MDTRLAPSNTVQMDGRYKDMAPDKDEMAAVLVADTGKDVAAMAVARVELAVVLAELALEQEVLVLVPADVALALVVALRHEG